VGDALATLARENILSAPVVDKDMCLVRPDVFRFASSLRFPLAALERPFAPPRSNARTLERSLMR
jgi:hypothetical protein